MILRSSYAFSPSSNPNVWILVFVALLAATARAGTPGLPDAPQATKQTAPAQPSPVTIPAGTRLTLALAHPVDSNQTHSGDQVSLENTSPVIANDQVLIPAGTFVQGKVDRLARRGSQAELFLRSISLVFPNGYIVDAGGPARVESEQWTAWSNPATGKKTAMFLLPAVGFPIGALIGHAADSSTTNLNGTTVDVPSHKGLVIGSAVGAGAGMVAALVLRAHDRQFYIQAGSPLRMSLPQAITLNRKQLEDALKNGADQTVPLPRPVMQPGATVPTSAPMPSPTTPGTPPIIIPGTPPTGTTPGTPNVIIPGTPPM